jgi:hypothetical protein
VATEPAKKAFFGRYEAESSAHVVDIAAAVPKCSQRCAPVLNLISRPVRFRPVHTPSSFFFPSISHPVFTVLNLANFLVLPLIFAATMTLYRQT